MVWFHGKEYRIPGSARASRGDRNRTLHNGLPVRGGERTRPQDDLELADIAAADLDRADAGHLDQCGSDDPRRRLA